MKAAVFDAYGPPENLYVAEVPKPVPESGQILVKVHSSTVNRTDCGFRSAEYFIIRLITGLRKPKKHILGCEFAGEVIEIGTGVTDFAVGDHVFGFDDADFGGQAEYLAIDATKAIAKIPKNYDYRANGIGVEGGVYALNYIWASGIKKGDKALVNGATGAIGSASVQLLHALGVDVTATSRGKHIKLVNDLGANRVIDYEKEDFTKISGGTFDLILDAVGKSSYGACKRLLKPTGIYCSSELGPYFQNPFLGLWFTITRSRKVIFPIPRGYRKKIEYLTDLMASGEYKSLIDRTYPLAKIVEATKYVETGQKIGSVILRIN